MTELLIREDRHTPGQADPSPRERGMAVKVTFGHWSQVLSSASLIDTTTSEL